MDAEGKVQISEAQQKLEDAMLKWKAVFEKYPGMLVDNQSYVEEALSAVYYWQVVNETNGTTLPADFALRDIWEQRTDVRPDVQRQFLLDTMRAKKK